MRIVLALTVALAFPTKAQHTPHFRPNRSAIVQLFEWTYDDIARECEQHLGPWGFAGVQTSAVTENLIVPGRPWFERYQPISYHLNNRSGNRTQLAAMVDRCNRAGVRVYVDMVLNHMARGPDDPLCPMIGTDGSTATYENRSFPAVPYGRHEFHRPCKIIEYNDAHMVRNCDLVGLPDLDQSLETVRCKIVALLDALVELGVAGFRVGGCKHMWPNDLKLIYGRVSDLSVAHRFEAGARPFYMQEVNDNGLEPISKTEYTFVGTVCEMSYASLLGMAFGGQLPISSLYTIGPANGFVHSSDALVYVDNHDAQRQPSNRSDPTLSFRQPQRYQMAVAFALAFDYGIVRLMSSYEFDRFEDGPPMEPGTERIRSPFDTDWAPGERRWVAEHRWPTTVQMVGWRNAVGSEPLRDWRSFGFQRIAFCRGARGFVAFNVDDDRAFDMRLHVCVPPGKYCNVWTRGRDGDASQCAEHVMVDEKRMAQVFIQSVGVVAIHVEATVE